MVYKNGTKEYIVLFCTSAIIYGVLMGTYYHNMIAGVFAGLVFGVVFTVATSVFGKRFEKKAAVLREEISKVREVICDGPANHQKGFNGIGGWLFLTEDAIEFYPSKMNFGGQNIPILLDDITNVQAKSNRLKVYTKKNGTYTFVVNKADLWLRTIIETV